MNLFTHLHSEFIKFALRFLLYLYKTKTTHVDLVLTFIALIAKVIPLTYKSFGMCVSGAWGQ